MLPTTFSWNVVMEWSRARTWDNPGLLSPGDQTNAKLGYAYRLDPLDYPLVLLIWVIVGMVFPQYIGLTAQLRVIYTTDTHRFPFRTFESRKINVLKAFTSHYLRRTLNLYGAHGLSK